MSEHEHTEPEHDERAEEVEDLEVPEGDQEDVAGGLHIRHQQQAKPDKL